jgi:hypothetical protein
MRKELAMGLSGSSGPVGRRRGLRAAQCAALIAASAFLITSVGVAIGRAQDSTAAVQTYGPGVPIEQRLFPYDNAWNTDISQYPAHPNSANYLASIGLTTGLHADFGTVWNGAPNGIPYVVVPASQAQVPISFYYADESDPGPYPIPPDAPIEGGSQGSGDRHVLVLDPDNHKLYEVYDAHLVGEHWEAGSGAVFDLTSNALRPDGWTSADAAGLPMLAGLVRYDEVASGVVSHALRFTVPRTQRAYVHPATHYASDSTDPNLPPMGLRLRLKASVDISGYPSEVQVILQALKTYGMFVADNGGAWYISGAPDPRWDDDALHQIGQILGRDFEVVDTRSVPTSTTTTRPPTTTTTRPPTTTTRPSTTTTTRPPTTTTTVPGDLRVAFTMPLDGASFTRGRVSVKVQATAPAGVAWVRLLVDGRLIGTDRATPFSFTWDAGRAAKGSHLLTVQAYDRTGRTSYASIRVTIR